MGYFSNLDMNDDYDHEEKAYALREDMIKVILQAFPDKNYIDLIGLEDKSLRGLYGAAKKGLKNSKEIEEQGFSVHEKRSR